MKLEFNSPEELVEVLSEGVLQACREAIDPADPDFDGEHLAAKVAAVILTKLTHAKEQDNALITVKFNRAEEAWESHIHFDYLSADREHFEQDFSWNTPPSHEGKEG